MRFAIGVFVVGLLHVPIGASQSPSASPRVASKPDLPVEERRPQQIVTFVGLIGHDNSDLRAAFTDTLLAEPRLASSGESVFGLLIAAIQPDSVSVTLGERALALTPGDVVVALGSEAPARPLRLDPVTAISVRRAFQSGGAAWTVILEDLRTGDQRPLSTGYRVFGYAAREITRTAAVLVSAGANVTSREEIHHTAQIPDLVTMGPRERSEWMAGWRSALSTRSAAKQRASREQMRTYWRNQWQGAWGDVISQMDPRQQEEVRLTVSAYWQ
jgi:hypothetical protein